MFQKLKILAEQNVNIANEMQANNAKNLVQLSADKGKVSYKNGSKMESFAVKSMRGQRAKVVIIDEIPEVDQEALDAIVSPILNYRRDISFNYDFKDYPSKAISITSACEKANSFYDAFLRTVKEMAKGTPGAFACALDYNAAAANGITDIDFFNKKED